jgi:hypothetical protein
MRSILAIPALALGVQISASDFHVVVRTTDAVLVTVTVHCPGDSALVPLNQYEERMPGSASWRAVGGTPPYTLVADEADPSGLVCFTVRDAAGREAVGCGTIGELRSSRVTGCNGSRSNGIPGGVAAVGGPPPTPGPTTPAPALEEEAKEDRPRIVRRTASRQEPTGGRPPIVREQRARDVQPPSPAPRPQQREGLRSGGTPPSPSPRRTTSAY